MQLAEIVVVGHASVADAADEDVTGVEGSTAIAPIRLGRLDAADVAKGFQDLPPFVER
ncbi:MAG: hypothetical protein U0Q12_24360 [Vicinamibacterales bacterium]